MKKIKDKVILFVNIERKQHDALRYVAYKEKCSIADIVREALYKYLITKYSLEDGLSGKEVKDEKSLL